MLFSVPMPFILNYLFGDLLLSELQHKSNCFMSWQSHPCAGIEYGVAHVPEGMTVMTRELAGPVSRSACLLFCRTA